MIQYDDDDEGDDDAGSDHNVYGDHVDDDDDHDDADDGCEDVDYDDGSLDDATKTEIMAMLMVQEMLINHSSCISTLLSLVNVSGFDDGDGCHCS